MSGTTAVEAAAGLLLVFLLPGYTTTRAIFPEWRVRGPGAWRVGLEVVTLSFVLSLGWTLVLGYLLLAGAPGGFQASWSDPELEVGLLVVTLLAFVAGWRVGAYATEPPPSAAPAQSGEEGAWELTRHLDANAREERRLEHALRVGPSTEAPGPAELQRRLDELHAEDDRLRQDREHEYAE